MWSSVLSCCGDCLWRVQSTSLRTPLVSKNSDFRKCPSAKAMADYRNSVIWADQGSDGDEEDDSKIVSKKSRSSSMARRGEEDPFENVSRNKFSHHSVKSRRDSSSDTDTSSVAATSKSSTTSLRSARGEPQHASFVVSGAVAPPRATTVAIPQQPRREDTCGRDLEKLRLATPGSPGRQRKESEQLRRKAQRTSSVSSSINSDNLRRTFLSPEEAACVAVDKLPATPGNPQAVDTPAGANSIIQWLSSSSNEKKSPGDKLQNVQGVTEKGSLGRFLGFVAGDHAGSQASYQYQATSGGRTASKVNLRSKATVQSIGAKKASLQAHTIAQYNFGFIYIAYKFSKEKKLEVDVLKVTKLPKFDASLFEDELNCDSKVPSLKYVDIEVNLRLSKGKELTHKIKKFRTGDDDTDDLPFEPECCFRHKSLEDCVLVLSVNRRQKNLVFPIQSVGHALLKFNRQDVQTPSILYKTLPLKHGVQRQDVKGSILLSVTCKHPVDKTTELSVGVRLVQHVDVSELGISPSMPDFKVKPEIKIKTQLIGSEKSGSSRAREFPWIGLQNNASQARRKEEAARDFGGWGTLFSEGCSTSRTVFESELKALTLSFVVQVYGRNNVGPAAKKEVLLGCVVLGPELRSSPEYPSSVEEGALTQWGEAVTKRTSVEQLHRLHL